MFLLLLGFIGSDKERWLWGFGIWLFFDIKFVFDMNLLLLVWLFCCCDKVFVILLVKLDFILEFIFGGCCVLESVEIMDLFIKIIK